MINQLKYRPRYLAYYILSVLVAMVWLINGLFCKVLSLVPRHQQIISRILSEEYSRLFTVLIGIGEIFIALWILSRYLPRICTITQVALIIVMNSIEFFMVPDLLLFGKMNAIFALLLVSVILYTEFVLRSNSRIPK